MTDETPPEDFDPYDQRAPQMNNSNLLAIVVAITSLAVQIGAWFTWGGTIETRVDATEKRQEQLEQRVMAGATQNAAQDVTIAVMTTQLSSIQSTVERIDKRTEAFSAR